MECHICPVAEEGYEDRCGVDAGGGGRRGVAGREPSLDDIDEVRGMASRRTKRQRKKPIVPAAPHMFLLRPPAVISFDTGRPLRYRGAAHWHGRHVHEINTSIKKSMKPAVVLAVVGEARADRRGRDGGLGGQCRARRLGGGIRVVAGRVAGRPRQQAATARPPRQRRLDLDDDSASRQGWSSSSPRRKGVTVMVCRGGDGPTVKAV